jgi:hypothetical protein
MNTLKHKIHDVVSIFRELWLIALFLIIGAVAFMLVEQGQDMMFAIISDFDPLPFIASLLALSVWAMQTGFGARMILIFSDLSFYPKTPEGLTEEEKIKFEAEVDQRVERKKQLSSIIPRILFWGPYLIMSIGYLEAYKTYNTGEPKHFALCIVLTLVSGLITYRISYGMYKRAIGDKLSYEEQKKSRKLQRANSLKELGKLRIVFFLAISSAALLIVIYSFLPLQSFQFLGAVHLIVLSFGCWIAMSYWIDYLDRKRKMFLKLFLFIYVCVISYNNHDHPVRIKEGTYIAPDKDVISYFDHWYSEHHGADSTSTPVFFVSAEGGASRSGYWTTLVLAQMQDEIPNFKNHVFSYSSVSGGTLGVNVFNIICKYKEAHPEDNRGYADLAKQFYTKDFLAPVTGRLTFGDVLNLFSPRMLECFDRAGILERSFEHSFKEIASEQNNLMDESFNTVNATGPAVFINTTEVESGKRALFSNVLIDTSFTDVVDVQLKLKANIRYSTAILFSARFPYLSPAGAIQRKEEDNNMRRHFVDGGYFENMGNITTMEVIQAVKSHCQVTGKNVKPVVILITNDALPGDPESVLFANEVVEPLNAFMNVRGGHTQHTLAQMNKFIKYPMIGGEVVPFNMNLSGKDVPMNWFMSRQTKERVDAFLTRGGYTTPRDRIKNMIDQ